MAGKDTLQSGIEALKGAVRDPKSVIQEVVRRSKTAPLAKKVFWDALPRPHFAYGIYQAATQAKHLGYDAMSVIEFGVAGGNGLVAMEELAALVGADTRVRIQPYGFDTGAGMPDPVDHRDLPYLWRPGDFAMDVEALRSRLTTAELVLGNVKDTVPSFFEEHDAPPVGFISFDLDFYSSTVDAFRLLDAPDERFLPRAFCYFDDVVGSDIELHCDWVGELLAIKEFNEAHDLRKIAPIHGLHYKRPVPAVWNAQMFVLHSFTHPRYGSYLPQPWEGLFDFSLQPEG